MQRIYKCLSQAEFINGDYRLISIRNSDRYTIMQWRNEQLEILRQKEPISREQQDEYFVNVVDKLFEQDQPNQLLFSFLEGDALVGYGGLVHIDWNSRNAEISFLTDTERSNNERMFGNDFRNYFRNYLDIIKHIAFTHLGFIKIHTTLYDIPDRDSYKKIIQEYSFIREARLERHVIVHSHLYDVCIYSLFNTNI